MEVTAAPTSVSAFDRLIAIEDIKQLKARYFRSLDTRDWAMFRTVFHDDVVIDFRGATTDSTSTDNALETLDSGALISGADRWVDICSTAGETQDIVTLHHGHMPEITILSADAAAGIWAMEDKNWWPEGAPFRRLQAHGHYHETYERVDGQWLIKSVRLTRLRVQIDRG
jgi:SnoaL-like domain